MEYKLLIDGQWTGSGLLMAVKNKYNGEIVGILPTARREDVMRLWQPPNVPNRSWQKCRPIMFF
jgi:hypothetical protein